MALGPEMIFRMSRSRVVVVGAGFGGLRAAKSLSAAPVDVLVVDRHNFHTFQPLLYQVATAALGADDIAHSARAILRRQRNARFRMGTVTGIDLEARRLTIDQGPPIDYDWLVLAAGATTDTYGVEGVNEHAYFLKSLSQALALRNHVLSLFEAATADPEAAESGALTFVVVGGGPTGVELAGSLAELVSRVLSREHPGSVVRTARVVLVEGTDRLLGGFSPESGDYARRHLGKLGVDVRFSSAVSEVTEAGVRLADGELIATSTAIWVAGVRAASVGADLGLPTGRGGRLEINDDLTLAGHPEVIVIGDVANTKDEGKPLPQVAPVAMQGGYHVGAVVMAGLKGVEAPPFRYRDKGSMATIGRNAAVAEMPFGFRLQGFPAWVAWLMLHLFYVAGIRNRINVMINWAWSYFTHDRGSRLVLTASRDESA